MSPASPGLARRRSRRARAASPKAQAWSACAIGSKGASRPLRPTSSFLAPAPSGCPTRPCLRVPASRPRPPSSPSISPASPCPRGPPVPRARSSRRMCWPPWEFHRRWHAGQSASASVQPPPNPTSIASSKLGLRCPEHYLRSHKATPPESNNDGKRQGRDFDHNRLIQPAVLETAAEGRMPAVQETVDQVRRIDVDQYKYGFVTDIESDKAPKGLSEDIVRFISAKKNEPVWMLAWRLDAYR